MYDLNMSKQISIYELAKRIIRLSGLTVKDKRNLKGDITIKITGLKKGEKLYEEVSLGKNLIKTPHPKIMKCDEKMSHKNFFKKIKKIEDLLNKKRFKKDILKDIVWQSYVIDMS